MNEKYPNLEYVNMNSDGTFEGVWRKQPHKPVIHTAGEPDGLIQKCVRCGYVLIDHTDTQSIGEWHPVWWSGNVYVRGSVSGATEEVANCEMQKPPSEMS